MSINDFSLKAITANLKSKGLQRMHILTSKKKYFEAIMCLEINGVPYATYTKYATHKESINVSNFTEKMISHLNMFLKEIKVHMDESQKILITKNDDYEARDLWRFIELNMYCLTVSKGIEYPNNEAQRQYAYKHLINSAPKKTKEEIYIDICQIYKVMNAKNNNKQ